MRAMRFSSRSASVFASSDMLAASIFSRSSSISAPMSSPSPSSSWIARSCWRKKYSFCASSMDPAASELIFSRSSRISTSRLRYWLMASSRRYRLHSVSIFCCSSKPTLSCEAMKSALWVISVRASKAAPTSLGTLGASATAFLNWPNILRARASSSVLCSISDVIFSICATG